MGKRFLCLQSVHISPGAHPACCLVGCVGCFPLGKAAGAGWWPPL